MSRTAQTGFVVLVVATLAMAMAIGGAHPQTLLPVALLVILGVALCYPRRSSNVAPLEVKVTVGLALYTLLQAVPLPLSVLAWLSPKAADVWSRALFPLGQPMTWGALSLDPGATVREALKWFLYAMCLRVALLAAAQRGRHIVALVVFGCSLCVAVAALGHALIAPAAVFGTYQPVFGTAAYGPLLNPNNLSGYLNLGAFTGLGLLLSRRLVRFRLLIAIGSALLFGTSVLSGSRGGVFVLAFGLVLFLAMVWKRRAEHLRNRAEWLPLVLTAAGALVFAVLGVTRATLDELLHDDLNKLNVLHWALPLVLAYPIFGVGRGAFEQAFAAYAPQGDNGLFAAPENLLVQWVSEWGIPVGLAAFGGYFWAFRANTSWRQSGIALGASVGVVALLVQNLVDLSLEVPAVPLLLTWALAAARQPTQAPATQRRRSRRSSLWRRWRWAGVPAVALGLWSLAVWVGREPASTERERLQRWVARNIKGPEDSEKAYALLADAMRRHPAEPYFARLGAVVAVGVGDPRAMRWIQRAFELWPNDARTHVLAARELAQRGVKAQALFELRHAVDLDPATARTVGSLAGRLATTWEELLTVAPPGTVGADVLVAASGESPMKEQSALRRRALREAIRRDPKEASARVALARDLLAELRNGTCADRQACEREAREQVEALLARSPESSMPVVLKAQLLAAVGKQAEAESLLQERCARLRDNERLQCLQARLRLVRGAEGVSQRSIRDAAMTLSDVPCHAGDTCANALTETGNAYAALGDWILALGQYEKAASMRPELDELLRVANAASRLGRRAQVEVTLRRAGRLAQRVPERRARLERAKAMAAKNLAGGSE